MAEQAYFAPFSPAFTPNPHSTALDNFHGLALTQNWRPGSKTYRRQRTVYMRALAENYVSSIESGGGGGALAGLQGLCGEVGIVGRVPGTVTQCKKVLKRVHVCIVHLIDHRRLGTPVHPFRSHAELQEHIKNDKHYFPKDEAKGKGEGEGEGRLLRVLLRTIDG